MAILTYLLLELHPLFGIKMPVEQLLFLYELGALGVGQFSPEVLCLKQVQEVQTLGIPVAQTVQNT